MSAKTLIEDMYPLSPMQEGMLFHSLYSPEAGQYVQQMCCTVKGALDSAVFRRAWERVVERHAVLRTAFSWQVRDQPFQVVYRKVRVPYTEEDWRGESPEEQERRLASFLAADLEKGFDLARTPLLRVAVFRVGEELYRLVWSHHHILLDGWCISLLVSDLLAFYESLRRGGEPALSPPPRYRDYIAWVRRQDLKVAEAFWRRELAGFDAATPLDFGRGAAPAVRGPGSAEPLQAQLVLPGEETDALRSFARRHRLTLNSLLQGAWGLVLGRYADRGTVVFGSVVAGRPPELPNVEFLIGLFINTLPVRVDLAPGETLLGLMEQVQKRLTRLREHESSPLTAIQKWSEVPAGSPLFESLVAFANYPGNAARGQEVSLRLEDVRTIERSNYPLVLQTAPGEGEWLIEVGFDPARFDAGAVGRLLGHLRTVLDAVVATPGRRLEDLCLLSSGEMEQLRLEASPAERAARPEDAALDRLWARESERSPDALALSCGSASLSYGEIEARANQLAHLLRDLGVGPEVRVAVLLERSPELVIALLAVVKAGGAYVPIDLSYPPERIAYLLADSGAPVLVSEEKLVQGLRAPGVQILSVDGAREAIRKQIRSAPASTAGAGNTAYVIYTSGTTGKPKGVLIPHSNVVRLFGSTAAWFGFGPRDSWTLFHSVAFDFSVWELWGAWLYGGRLVVVPYWVSRSPEEFHELLGRERVTVLNQTPSAFHLLARVDAAKGAERLALRWVIFGGEALEPGSLRGWFERHGDRSPRLVNMYGITETTVHVTYRPLSAAELSGLPGSVIGRPIPDLTVRVLDRFLQPQPLGVVGEVYVGRAGLATGYLGRPELTAERFVPDLWPASPGSRLYRSGDLARRLPGGDLEYLGRADHQIKLRGFRIETGEIEAALREHGAVGDVAVVAREHGAGDLQLVAYVVPAEAESGWSRSPAWAAELRGHLASRLPDYMVPAAFVALDRLPLTAHGKLDRQALPAPELRQMPSSGSPEPPQDPLERQLAEIWAEVLGIPQVGRRDNFFELGGDSILSIKVVSRLHRAGYSLTPRHLFDHPTIAELAVAVGRGAEQAAPGSPAPEAAAPGPFPLTPIQSFFFELAPVLQRPEHWNMPLLLAPRGRLRHASLASALSHLVTRHEALRLRFRQQSGQWLQELASEERAAPLTTVDLTGLPELRQSAALAAAAALLQGSLNLASGPLLRVAFFSLSAGLPSPCRLLLAAHHLVVDAVSWRILVEDLAIAYDQAERGTPFDLGPRTASYRVWAERLAEHARSAAVLAELPYWQEAGALPQLRPLPRDGVGANRESSSESLTSTLAEPATRSLLREVQRLAKAQPIEVLLTALARTVTEWTGDERVLLELEGHGRESLFPDLDVSRTVGWFTSLYPLALTLAPKVPVQAALRQVKERFRAVPNQGIGYGLLRYLARREELSAAPRPELLFNYLGNVDGLDAEGPAALGELASEPIGPAQDPAALRSHLLEVNCAISGGCLQVTWTYSAEIHQRRTIERLAGRFLAEVEALVEACLHPATGSFSPADFPLAAIAQERLDALVQEVPDLEDLYPLSPLQQGMLFDSLAGVAPGVALGQFAYELRGNLNPASMRRAWQAMLDRHPVLRTSFHWVDLEEPLQAVHAHVDLPWEEHDWRSLPAGARAARLEEYLQADRERPFSPSCAPLLRLAWVSLGDGAYLIWTHHHLLLDGWSMPLIVQEVLALYRADLHGYPAGLAPAVPFGNYIAWLRRQDMAGAEAFWRRYLAGLTAPTPVDSGPPEGGRGPDTPLRRSLSIQLSAEETAGLSGFARTQRVTMNTLVQAAWALLLSRYSGERDVLFGTVRSGRPAELPGADEIVGLLINNLPMRVAVPGAAEVGPWLAAVQRSAAETSAYEFTPLYRIAEWSELPKDRALFDSFLTFENYPVEDPRLIRQRDLELVEVRQTMGESYPLVMTVEPGERLAGELDYDAAAFDPPTIARILHHLVNLMSGLQAGADARLDQIPTLAPAERQQLVWEDNDTWQPAEQTESFESGFERLARSTPNALAVQGKGERLSYAELDARADALAARLKGLGIGPERTVGICLENSSELVVAVLAVLKAGGAFLPIDPALPAQRIALLLEDGQHEALLTQRTLLGRLPASSQPRILLDEMPAAGGANPSQPVRRPSLPDSLAYILFTSGSTGRPKGVMVSRRGLMHYLRWCLARYGPQSGSGALLQTSIGFDLTVTSLFAPLLAGRTVFVRAEGALGAPAPEIPTPLSFAKLTPSHFQLLEHQPEDVSWQANLLILGGEALLGEAVAALRSRAPLARIVNEYGPTEAVVGCAVHEVAPDDSQRGPVSIGRPIAGSSLHLLGPGLVPVPFGVPGEIFVGGPGLARGYVGRPDATAERFLPDPFAQAPGSRLYRTGDLGRRRPDGSLDYLGRTDHQIKLRGFRIELGEVESALRRHRAVRECTVMVRTVGPGDRQMVGYWVPAAGAAAASTEELRQFLQQRLPEYMIPAFFLRLESLPRNRNGKIDRDALPAPGMVSRPSASPPREPRTPLEERLAAIWRELLNLPQVGVDENFFELGGHSLRALSLVSSIRRTFGVRLPLATVLAHPTIRGLSLEVAALQAAQTQEAILAKALAEIEGLTEEQVKSALEGAR